MVKNICFATAFKPLVIMIQSQGKGKIIEQKNKDPQHNFIVFSDFVHVECQLHRGEN
jgi:hypothetical protein